MAAPDLAHQSEEQKAATTDRQATPGYDPDPTGLAARLQAADLSGLEPVTDQDAPAAQSAEIQASAGYQPADRLVGGHLRIVPSEPTVAFVSRQPKPFMVRWSRDRRTDDAIRPDDEAIAPSPGYPRLLSLVVHSAFTPGGRPSSLSDGAATVHLMGTEPHRLMARVEVAPGFVRVTERTIQAERDRAEVERAFSREAQASASAVTGSPDFETQRAQATLRRVAARQAAFERRVLPVECFDSWDRLFNTMTALAPALNEAIYSPAEAGLAADRAEAFTQQAEAFTQVVLGAPSALMTPLSGLHGALRQGDGQIALDAFVAVSDAFDRWLIELLGDAPQAHELGAARAKDNAYEAIAENDPTPIPVRFFPRGASLRAGGPLEVPLDWHIWRADGQWHLRDSTNPARKTFTYSHPDRGEPSPPAALFGKVDNAEHFVEGELFFDTPDGARHHLTTTAPMAWSDWLAIFGVALLAVGAGMVTLGTGAVAVIGQSSLVLSGMAFAGSAASHIGEQAEHGTLTAAGIALDVTQILACLATAGAATIAARGLGGALAAGRSAMYVGLSRAAIGADVASLLVMTGEAWHQLDVIGRGPGSDEDKARAATILIGALLIQGALTAVGARNEAGALDGHPIVIEADGDALIIRSVGGVRGAPGVAYRAKSGHLSPGNLPGRLTTATRQYSEAADLMAVPDVRVTLGAPEGGIIPGQLEVPTADGMAVIELRFRSEAHEALPEGVHGASDGPIRMDVAGGADGLAADIVILRDLHRGELSAAVAHELDELAQLARQRPDADGLRTQQKASVMRPGGVGEPTAHDRATARQVERLQQRSSNPAGEALADPFVKAKLDAWGLGPGPHDALEKRLDFLRREGVNEEWLRQIEAWAVAQRHAASPQTVIDAQLVNHLLTPEFSHSSARTFVSGGHFEPRLRTQLSSHPELEFIEMGALDTVSGNTYRAFAQFRWTGVGGPPTGPASRPHMDQGRLVVPDGWQRARDPKTTFTDIDAFTDDITVAWQDWLTSHPGQAVDVGANLSWTGSSGRVRISGYATRAVDGRIVMHTAFPDASGIAR